MADKINSFNITFQPLGLRDRFREGKSILECTQAAGIDLVGLCGGNGTCGKCNVQIVDGQVTAPTRNEKKTLTKKMLDSGFRLACQTFAKDNLVVNIPTESLSAPQRLQVEGKEIPFSPDPSIHTYNISLTPPSLADLRGDDIRVMDALYIQHGLLCETIDEALLGALSPYLRSANWNVDVSIYGHEIISVDPPGNRSLGLAVDLGTTKVAGYLVDLQTGEITPVVYFGGAGSF